jgi:hypothetical protein
MASIDTNIFAEVAPKVISGILLSTLMFWGIASAIYRGKKDVKDDVNEKLKDTQR